MSKATLNFSPLSKKIFWGRTNDKGCSVGQQRDVTSDFLQVMEMKFPVNTCQYVSIDGENKYMVLVVDLTKEVIVNGKVMQHKGSAE